MNILESLKDERCTLEVNTKPEYFSLYINADTNDGDYINDETTVNNEDIHILISALRKLREYTLSHHWHDNWANDFNNFEPRKEYLNDEEYEVLNEFVPYGEYGVHTIEDAILYYNKGNERYSVKY